MMYKLSTFGFNELMALRSQLRNLFNEALPSTIEEAAQRVVQLFRNELGDDSGRPACALVRLYKTHPFARLDEDLQAFAREIQPSADNIPGLRCLVLVASAGDEPAWNSRHQSRGHRAIPLSSEKAVEEAPMIAQLIKQLGVSVATVLKPDPGLLLKSQERTSGVFYVPTAAGSPYIPAQQDFVIPYGIQSVIGFGGMLASGDLVATIIFSRVSIPRATADLFTAVGLNFKLAMLKVAGKPLFGPAERP